MQAQVVQNLLEVVAQPPLSCDSTRRRSRPLARADLGAVTFARIVVENLALLSAERQRLDLSSEIDLLLTIYKFCNALPSIVMTDRPKSENLNLSPFPLFCQPGRGVLSLPWGKRAVLVNVSPPPPPPARPRRTGGAPSAKGSGEQMRRGSAAAARALANSYCPFG